ncbi:MAG TPA: aspartate 1-decarboxylase [Dehalococcoidales bacterium]|nr:aspartate 1-decarboxylase [Dehalococcoidales bacterium]
MLKSKIHRATVTEANLEYEGSIAIDKRLMDEADILPYEQVQVLNADNGARFTTYAIEGPTDSGMIGIQGPAARLASKGDIVVILTYRNVKEAEVRNFLPRLVYVDENNVITKTKHIVDAIPF